MSSSRIKKNILARAVQDNDDMSVEELAHFFKISSIPILVFTLSEYLETKDYYKMLCNDTYTQYGYGQLGNAYWVKRKTIMGWGRTEYWVYNEFAEKEVLADIDVSGHIGRIV